MDIFEQFATDATTEVEGARFELGKDAWVLVARANNERFTTELRAAMKRNAVVIDSGGPDADALAETLIVDAMSKTILLGWGGLKYKGQPVSYSPSQAATLLRLKDFRKRISGFSETFDAYRVKAEEAQGNG
jgi:hypothetical protein